MKSLSRIKRMLSVLMSVIMIAALSVPIHAETRNNPFGIPDDQYENIVAFMETVNPATGEKNGQQYCLGYGMSPYDESEEVQLDAIRRFVGISYPDSPTYPEPTVFDVYFYYPDYNDPTGTWVIFADDLYGRLDLSGTGIGSFADAPSGLTGIDLSDCENLESFDYRTADACDEILLANCPALERICLYRTNTRNIVVEPAGFAAPVVMDVFGNGVINALEYCGDIDEGVFDVEAKSNTGIFVGWFADGALVSTDEHCRVSGFDRLTACFAGDTDGDGVITVADTVAIARAALNLGSFDFEFNMADIDMSGDISIADALSVMRFSLWLK